MNKKKMLALSLAFSTAFGSVQAFAANFTDINDVPWEGAKTYINSVADLGLMVGDYNDNNQLVFRSRDGVTYCETMQLAYALMQKCTGASVSSAIQTKWTSVMNGYKIPTWAQPAVAYGLENGIVTISDIPGFVDAKGSANVNATREDVAVIFGRTLKDYGTLESNPTLSFGDAASISATAKPYVAMLTKLGILSGDTDGNYTPKYAINRAEMAVVVSKSYDVCKKGTSANTGTSTQSQSISGEVSDLVVYGNQIILTVKSDSTTKSFNCTYSTPTLRDGSNTSLSLVQVGDGVLVSYQGDTVISVVANSSSSSSSSSSSQTESSAEGTFYSISEEYIRIKVGSSTKTYYFEEEDSDNCDFYVNSKSVSYSTFKSDAVEGYKVKVNLSGNEAQKVYLETIISGELDTLYDSKIKVKINGSTETYYFKNKDYDDVEFYIDDDDSSYSSFKKEAEEGMTVELVLNDDEEVEEINLVTDEDDDEVKGTFSSISSTKIVIKKSGSSKTYYFEDKDSDNCTFYYNNSKKDYDYIDDKAESGDNVKLVLNDDDEVTKVYVTPADEDEDEVEDYLYSLTSSYIILEDDTDQKYRYPNNDADQCKFYYNGSACDDYDEIKRKVGSTTGQKVKLVLDEDECVIKAYIGKTSSSSSGDEDGRLDYVTTSRVRVAGTYYDFEDSDDCDIDITDGSNSTIRDFDDLEEAIDDGKEMEVTIELNDDDEVISIEGYVCYVEGDIYDMDTRDETVTLDLDSGRYEYDLDSSCDYDIGDDYDDDIDGLEDAYDDDDSFSVELEIDEDGYVTDLSTDI